MTLTSNAIQSAQSVRTGSAWLWLLEIDHVDLVEPFYLVNNSENITSNGIEYQYYGFDIVPSIEDGESLPQVKLVIDNVDRLLVETIRSISETPTINIKMILSNQPDIVEYEITELSLRNVTYDAFTITGTLYADDILNSRFPADTISLAGGYFGMFK